MKIEDIRYLILIFSSSTLIVFQYDVAMLKKFFQSKLELKVKETPEVSLQTMRKDVKKEVDNEVRYNYTVWTFHTFF